MDRIVHRVLRFEGFALDLTRGCLRTSDRDVELRPKTFEVLRHLAENAGRLVPKDELFRAVWPGVFIGDDSLAQCVRELRDRLGDESHRLIKTVARRGYLLDAKVESAPPADSQWADGKVLAPRLSIVVLPFENVGGDPEQEYFADGITEDVTADLSRLSGSVVIARSTAYIYKGKPIDPRQVGRELGVRYVLEGTVRRAGDKVRITARLVNTANAAGIWTENFDTDRSDLSVWRDEITIRLSRIFGAELVHAETARSLRERPNNPDAIDLTMRAWSLFWRIPKGGDLSEPRRLFREALQLDEALTDAWIGVARTYLRNVRFSATRDHDLQQAGGAGERAVALAPTKARAHLAKAWVLYERNQMEQALFAFEYAAQLDPNDVVVQSGIAAANVMLGRTENALEPLQKAMRLSPRDPELPTWQLFIGVSHLHLGHDKEAIDWLNRSLALNPSDQFTHLFLAGALALSNRQGEAATEIAELLRLKPGFTLSRFKSLEPSKAPVFLAQRERVYEGLRRAGLPE